MALQIARRQFTVNDYHRMRETGILTEDDRVELIDGEVRLMSPVGPFHAAIVKRLNALLSTKTGEQAIISIQDPIQLDDHTEPEPDIAILRFDDTWYAQRHPTPADIFFVIEVADTSLEYDRDEKLPRYAASGIQEAWLIDIEAETVAQYTQPAHNIYTLKQTFKRGELIRSATFPAITLPVDHIFG
ncbi:Uma2 family endonuclease [Roseiflexus sp.]|uniref:Uma2 family endonuclease n=1 Tax=Roseiflexus sp. TaxID=2562120 RepID=UPI00398B2B17